MQILQVNLIIAVNVRVSPPDIRVSITQTTLTEWQNTICESSPPYQNFGTNCKATTKVTLRVTNEVVSIFISVFFYFRYTISDGANTCVDNIGLIPADLEPND